MTVCILEFHFYISINYDIKLVTKTAEFVGKYFKVDSIIVQDDDVEILKVDN